jgi:L-ascorbate metabolism protein UlaG (beta-lactamase superfamily)
MVAKPSFETDIIQTSAGDLQITFLGHGSLAFAFSGMRFYIDPFSKVADYVNLPKADIVLITHEHSDHLDPAALAQVKKADTAIILTEACASKVTGGIVMHNGDERTLKGLHITAVPAYNVLHKRENGQPFHPKGAGNGYILEFGDRRVYVAGDTEDTPEMMNLKGISIAFLPMNLPYTMTPEMVANAAKALKPDILYPYHFGETKTARLAELLKSNPDIEVRIRKMA